MPLTTPKLKLINLLSGLCSAEWENTMPNEDAAEHAILAIDELAPRIVAAFDDLLADCPLGNLILMQTRNQFVNAINEWRTRNVHQSCTKIEPRNSSCKINMIQRSQFSKR